ncbi:LysR family transcriptional regulator [Methylobacterium pseudosasicola]|uniref:DNA-binding transcriptional regulator, LysR family n=1 Tax=Methylobacterium pseudosasicola TaxID=582667 RepID=A0A1I4GN95_9HYPH|nr:LysR family transcriptional regulator [Methylobacterium pseudosasicola]SFL31498.1 DNA-binding transcriptional regulator, LysR family [Methylobacterium pseudosasicola]
MNTPDWTLLRSFLAVVDMRSLSAAAARVGATQPTLSRHIRALETAFGVTLFTRTARGLEPTEAALSLIADARAMGAAAEALALKAQGRAQGLSGTVRITASVMVANLLLPPILAELRAAEPRIQIELVASDQAQNLLRRDADIAIRMFDPTQNALIARRLGEAPLGLFGTHGYFERRGRPRTVADLAGHDVLGFDRNDALLRAYAAHGLRAAREDFSIRCDDQMVYWNLMLAGAGLGFAQVLLAGRQPELEQAEIGLHIAPLPVWLVLHEEVRGNARIRRVADFVSGALIDVLRGG